VSGWWRRNRRALIAVIILLPLTAGVAGGWEWWKRVQGRPTFATIAPAGEAVDFGGITFGPATAEEITVPDVDLPENTTVIAVDVEIDRHGATTACSTPVLRELSGEGRLWEADMSKVGWASRYYTFCPSDPDQDSFPTGPFSIDVPFIVPDDVVGELGVEFLVVDELPRYVRLVVSP
jgi:hypothetical protein